MHEGHKWHVGFYGLLVRMEWASVVYCYQDLGEACLHSGGVGQGGWAVR